MHTHALSDEPAVPPPPPVLNREVSLPCWTQNYSNQPTTSFHRGRGHRLFLVTMNLLLTAGLVLFAPQLISHVVLRDLQGPLLGAAPVFKE